MADIELVIKIDEDAYKEIKKIVADGNEMCFMQKIIANGIPLPKGHGRLIDVNDIEWAKFTRQVRDVYYEDIECVDWEDIEKAPTIIEAIRRVKNDNFQKRI